MTPDDAAPPAAQDGEVRREFVTVDGHRISYLTAGPSDGHPMVLVHGLLADATTWSPVLAGLAAKGFRVVAPDMLGHGESDKPTTATYRLAEFASMLDLTMTQLGIGSAILGGHSLGGGTAIAVSHLFPQRVERLVLVASGGFGTDLHPVLRGATLPGAQRLVRAAVSPRSRQLLAQQRLHRALRLPPVAVANLSRLGRNLQSDAGRMAFFATLNEAIDRNGQRGSMVEMGYVDASVPTLLVWSERDPIIPVSHARVAHAFFAESRLELFPGVSHEPHRRHPQRFVDVVGEFLQTPG